MKYITASTEETEALAARLAQKLERDGNTCAFIALFGEVGAGKTAFTRGFAGYLGIKGVKSPTYTVVNEYKSGTHPVFHFDFYRIDGSDDLASIGYDDYLKRRGYKIGEWCEMIEDELPKDAIRVTITRCSDNADKREIDMGACLDADTCV